MMRLVQILTVLLVTNTAFSQSDTARYYRLSDKNIWVGKTYILNEPYWGEQRFFSNEDLWTCFDSVIVFLENNPKLFVEIGYHTDSRPIPLTVDTLSSRRAERIKKYFVENGISSKRILAHGYGDDVPRIIEKDTNMITPDRLSVQCRDKTFFIKKNTVLNDNFIKTIQDPCFKELIHYLNRRPEMKIIKIE